MKAEIISIGTELLLGTITDTNASYLAGRLSALGIDCYYVSHVGDNLQRLRETIERAWERSDLTVTTGGLGPTGDDLTREAIAALLGEEMVVQPRLERRLRAFFRSRGVEMPESNMKQATLIDSATTLANPVGTAPGWWVEREVGASRRIIVSMPGVPFEMKRMWEQEVEPRLQGETGAVICSRTLKVIGLGESAVEARVRDFMDQPNPTLAPYAKQDGVHLRITAKSPSRAQATELIAGLESRVRERLGDAVYGSDTDTPASVARDLLTSAGKRIVIVEIGEAAGTVSSLMGGHPNVPLSIALPDLTVLYAWVEQVHSVSSSEMEDLLEGLAGVAGAELAVLIDARTADIEPNEAVGLDVSLVLVYYGVQGSGRSHRETISWRTSASEVKRLCMLAGFNLIRKALMKAEAHVARFT